MLRSIHTGLDRGEPALQWPEIIPQPYRDRLHRRTGLRDRLVAYRKALSPLPPVQRCRLLRALQGENEIGLLLSGASDCDTLLDLPERIRGPVSRLFDYAFELLTDLGIRDSQYQHIYNARPDHVCPFCGCEHFDAPMAPREALDHYLTKSLYPFAAVNLRNLVSMGSKCNSTYKLAQNILRKADGTRRRAIDPYNHSGTHISLENSQPFADTHDSMPIPRWQIDFDPDCEEVATWDEVFHIRERYERDVLRRHFERWVGDFGQWWSADRTIAGNDVLGALDKYIDVLETMSLGGHEYLRVYAFRMLHKHCQDGNQRLKAFLKDVGSNPIYCRRAVV